MKTNSMYCPACGTENSGDDRRFCRSCGTDLRAVSQALSKSLPVKLASTLDSYLENRFQRNFMNGVLNLIAFFALLVAGTVNLISGFAVFGGLLLGLGLLALILGIWDIWIYRRNLPPVARSKPLEATPTTKELTESRIELAPPASVAESTTRKLDLR
jgi:zinc-ribbon domain